MGHGTCSPPAKPVGEMLRKSTDDFVCVFNYMNHDHNATGHSPFYLSHGYFPCKPRLALAPSPTRHQSMVHRWASTLASHLKTANSDAVSWDSQAKQRLVARNADEPTPFHAVMMHVPISLASKLQSGWQGQKPVLIHKIPMLKCSPQDPPSFLLLMMMHHITCASCSRREPVLKCWNLCGGEQNWNKQV